VKRGQGSRAGGAASEVSSAFGRIGSGASSIGDDLDPADWQQAVSPPARRCRGG
jgi:hypothetical protein